MTIKNKLLIWDFDGVIADSEHLWVKNWTDTLRDLKNIRLTPEQQKYYLEGKADKTKMEMLPKDFPSLVFDDAFWAQIRANEARLIASELTLTTGVTEILKDDRFAQCVATGATLEKHNLKVIQLHLEKYFNERNTFTAYQVLQGKPAPDIFLYAADAMGYQPKDCLVLEDSLAGISAAKSAGIPVIAYIGATGHNSPEYAEKCRQADAFAVCNTMAEAHQLIVQHFFA